MSNRNRKKVRTPRDIDREFKVINGYTGETTIKTVKALDKDVQAELGSDMDDALDYAEAVASSSNYGVEPVPVDSKFDRVLNYSIFTLLIFMSPILGGVFSWFMRYRAVKKDEFVNTYRPMKVIGTIVTILYLGLIAFLGYLKFNGIIEWDL